MAAAYDGIFMWPLSPPRHCVRPARRGSRAATPVVLYGISVWVGWADGDTQRQVRLDTEQVGGAG